MTSKVRTSLARDIPAGAKLFRIGSLAVPGLVVEQVRPDPDPEMQGWVDLSVWAPRGQRTAWTDEEDETAFLGMIGLSVPAVSAAVWEIEHDAR